MRKVLLILFILLVSCEPASELLTGKVISVADGDTVTILTENDESIKIRLEGIDAPERGQDFGGKSRQYLNELCYGKTVKVEKKGVDQYGRVLGIVYVGDLNLNEEQVRSGLAWYYRHYVNDPRLDLLEQTARNQKLNIWSQKNPLAPWEFRKNKRDRNK